MTTERDGVGVESGTRAVDTSIESLAGTLAHDCNNLLTTILGYGNLLLESFTADDPRRADVAEIIRAAKHAGDLTHHFLQTVRHEARGPRVDGGGAAAVTRAGDPPPSPPQAPGHATVLVVEDERAVRYLVRTILTRSGYTVHDADGPEAAESFLDGHEEPLDLLIADIMMPGASGPELFERARARRPALRVLYMSGYSDEAVQKDRLVAPGAAFIQKPFTADLLSRKVREVLQP